MEEETNIITNEIILSDTADTVYKVASNIHTMLSVLTFTIIIIFLYKFLKSNFSLKK